MPAVVRVKRRIDEEPLSAFILNGKRRRLEEESASALSHKEELSSLLKFAGTIKELVSKIKIYKTRKFHE